MGSRESTTPAAGNERAHAGEATPAREYLDLAKRRGWVIVVMTLLAVAGAYTVTRLLPKTYEAKASLFVGSVTARNRDEANAVLYNGQVSANLARSYATFATSTTTLRDAEARLGTHVRRNDIEAAPMPDSQILEITGTASTARVAAARANAASDALVAEISARRPIAEAQLSIVNRAMAPSKPAKPKLGLNLALGALVGLLLGYAAAVIWERLSPRRRTR